MVVAEVHAQLLPFSSEDVAGLGLLSELLGALDLTLQTGLDGFRHLAHIQIVDVVPRVGQAVGTSSGDHGGNLVVTLLLLNKGLVVQAKESLGAV